MKKARIIVTGSAEECAQVKHAASLRHVSIAEYIKQAINAQLRKEGVDAVLFREKGDEGTR